MEESQSESPSSRRFDVRRLITVRRISLVLLVVLLCIVVTHAGECYRRVYFRLTGTAVVDGLTFYLPSGRKQYVTEGIMDNGSWEPHRTAVLLNKLQPGDTMIDVGAHVGWYTVFASRKVGSEGRVIAFEPDPANFALLKRNVEVNGCDNVILEQKALSDAPGTITLFHKEARGSHSIVLPSERELSVEVEAVTLDDYLEGHNREINFVKIDVEGAEGLVLGGMRETLQSQKNLSILMEYSPMRLLVSGHDPRELLTELHSDGFVIYDFLPMYLPTNAQDSAVESTPEEILARCCEYRVLFTDLFLEREKGPSGE